MTDPALVTDILAIYKKHGWTLRRVLLSDSLKSVIDRPEMELFGGVTINDSSLDGLWFSRPSKGSLEAWELRHLAAAPYALLEVIERDIDKNARETILSETESRMLGTLRRKN